MFLHNFLLTVARNLRRADIAEGVIMKIGGWRTHNSFERYAIVSHMDIAETLQKLSESRLDCIDYALFKRWSPSALFN